MKFFFDMDGTICESRQQISSEMKEVLKKFQPFVVVSGASKQRIEYQMDGLLCIMMGQNGNDTPDWQNKLSQRDVKEIFNHIHKIYPYFPDDCIQNRGCQMSLSFIGHNADIKDKKKFDPQKRLRHRILNKIPFKSKTLTCRVAGTTCFDYNKKGHLKGDNLRRYMKLHKLNPKDCVYFGDNFSKGGNDESVKGVMKCVEVSNPQELLLRLKNYE
ncbi:HAD-IIB family hydrolase [Candidatus Dojkabacteria bacterium]|jgi:HAD superfamily hydrolase (TIGR01484 family)|nr:HAD-IIB family hydrolase [Candidatus Dojkabacteria bacterium]